MTAADIERRAIDHALAWLRRGKVNVALNILVAAAVEMAAQK